MPLGFERINSRRQQPNDLINFIKPLDGPDRTLSEDFLQRIAASCKPIMRSNHLAVMSLEEHKCNSEFLGRNFNAGEVIQLVLKSPSGHWLPFKFVQMVMMHELAHCKHMNHSKAFWSVKNQYSTELKILWQKGYTGDGMWSRGRTLLTGQYDNEGLGSGEVFPDHLCGGTFRSSSKRKRGPKPKLSYKERKERTIMKKFGANGVTLGADHEAKAKLEKGKVTASNPRVAASNRGRELRAMAALSRVGAATSEGGLVDDEIAQSGTDSEGDGDSSDLEEAVDLNGKKMQDRNGRPLIRVCDDEETDEIDVKLEMSELLKLGMVDNSLETNNSIVPARIKTENKPSIPQPRVNEGIYQSPAQRQEQQMIPSFCPPQGKEQNEQEETSSNSLTCPVCSAKNDYESPTCVVCANVLDSKRVFGVWRCQSDVCQGGLYTNAGDYGVCGLCGIKRLDSLKMNSDREDVYINKVL